MLMQFGVGKVVGMLGSWGHHSCRACLLLLFWIACHLQDVQRGLYDAFHVNFATHINRPLLEKLAAGGWGRCGEW